jgi:hypothetical protein
MGLTWQVSSHKGHVVLLAILGDQQLTDLLQDIGRQTNTQINIFKGLLLAAGCWSPC